MKITDILIYPVCVPVKPIRQGGIAPYMGCKDTIGTTHVTSTIYKVLTDEGLVGWGEMNMIISLPFTKIILEEYIKPRLIGQDPFNLNQIMQSFETMYNPDINTRHFAAAVETALWDLMGKAVGKPIYQLLGGKVRDRIEIAYAMGLMSREDTAAKIRQIKAEGYTTIKTKGGSDVLSDIRRLHEMREISPGLNIRVDMNQGYGMVEAIRYCREAQEYGLQYIEQPIPVNRLEDMRSLRNRFGVPVAINEDCYIPGNLMRAIRMEAIDAAVVDFESLGGISQIINAAHLAESAGLALAHHCAWDLGVKLAGILQGVSTLPAFSLPMDSTYQAHADDILTDPIPIENGCYVVSEKPGLGVDVDEEKLQSLALGNDNRFFVF